MERPLPALSDVNADCRTIIAAPVAEVYKLCLRFEEFPRFITSITKISRISDTEFSCTSLLDGQQVESVVTILMRIPERRLTWQAGSGNFRVGVLLFESLPGGRTKVRVKIRSTVDPARLTAALRLYLRNFKRILESAS